MSENAPIRLEAGDTAPALDLRDDAGTLHTWGTHAGQRVVLYVYPAAMTPGCTTQACDFRDSLDALHAAGITVLGLSPDKPEKLHKFRERDGLTFPLLSDPDRTVLTALGAYGEKKLYGKTVVGVIRSTFVVDVDGNGNAVVERAMYAVKATGHVAKLRRELGV
jgi:peroxiredoxin Q/BCP